MSDRKKEKLFLYGSPNCQPVYANLIEGFMALRSSFDPRNMPIIDPNPDYSYVQTLHSLAEDCRMSMWKGMDSLTDLFSTG
jgi:hypothetical protein